MATENQTALTPLPFHLMAKPAGPRCNMACRYCFYLEKSALLPEHERNRMSDEVLEAYIRGVAEATDAPELHYAWQGGEPTLMGVDFFRKAVELQKRCAGGRPVSNAFQTNGILLDDEWCEFFAREGFLVGLSLDGPRDIQDRYRLDGAGRPRFDEVMAALERLRKHRVSFNALVVVSEANARRPLDVYRFLRDSGVEHIQFIGIVERKPDDRAEELGLDLAVPPVATAAGGRQAVMPWSASPEDYGAFLIAVFDEWVRRDVGRIFVQTFEVALGNWMGLGSGLCHYAPRCGRALVVEYNGDVYACDHYVYPEYRRGNLLERPLREIVDAPEQIAFGNDKWDLLPDECRACPFLFACNGACPKHRFVKSAPQARGMNWFCPGYKAFWAHIDPYMRAFARLLRSGQPAPEIMRLVAEQDRADLWRNAKRNEPCPCGSGRKFKNCHGAAEEARRGGQGA